MPRFVTGPVDMIVLFGAIFVVGLILTYFDCKYGAGCQGGGPP